MPPRQPPQTRHLARWARNAARSAAGLALLAGTAAAQPDAPALAQVLTAAALAQPADTLDPLDITGRTFAGLRLPLAPVPGVVEFAANKARVWIEQDGDTITQRLMLDGDVAVTLGGTRLEADRAVVWLEKLPGNPGDAQTYQVYAYFDSVGSIAADAGSSLQARRLSVDGVVMSARPVELSADLAEQGRPRDAFLRESEREFTRYLRELLLGAPVALDDVEPAALPPETGAGTPGRYALPQPASTLLERPPTLADPGDDIFARDGLITFDAGQIAIVTGESGRSLLLTDGVGVLYRDTKSKRRLQMSAERAVVFLSDGTIAELSSFKSEDIRGIYLEGDVSASDGEYTIRGPRIYYDVQNDRAMVVDAVFWTYDQRMRMPLYVRAKALRQESNRQFVAEQATVANTRFARPHLSIGAQSVTIDRYTRTDGTTGNNVDAHDMTLRAGSVPFFYFPRWDGDPDRFPLRDFEYTGGSRTGQAWKSSWDVYTLLGMERPEGLDSVFLLDYYNVRGWAIGTDTSWQTDRMRGGVFGYLMFDDSGTDLTPGSRKIEVDGETRSLLLADNRWQLNELWSLTTELSYASDPRLISALFPDLAEEYREFTTRARLERTDANSQLALEAKSDLNDFIANYYLLESRGYSVDKLPELSYVRTLDDLTANISPGAITLNSEYRAGQLAFNFHDPAARELGFRNSRLSQAAFGVDPAESIADALRAQGLSEDTISRFDTRQEISAVLDAGPLRINPFLVGRATAYDTDFEEFSPEESDSARLWGAAGVRLSTTLQHVDNSIDSAFFDLHRVRHIVEPGVTLWHAGTTVDRIDLPVYDEAVESIAEGSIVRLGVDQTWQTKRGGPGRWTNVDVLKLRTEYVWASGDADRDSPIGRYFDDRPELSSVGEFIDAEMLWQVSDPVGLTGRIIYDVEETHQPAYSAVGLLVDHGYGLRSSVGQRFVNALDSTIVFYNLQYDVTDKYRVTFSTNYDTALDDFERISATLTRSYPNLTVGLAFSFNNINDETSFGFILSPRGIRGGLGLRSGRSSSSRGSSFGG
ncbi:MAG: hypothetical protein ACF8R9_01840 [Phycisphaerales bacterium JB054]